MNEQKGNSTPKIYDGLTIQSVEFCKPLREGIITQKQITDRPLVNLEQIDDYQGLTTFELNIIAFVPESLSELNPSGSYIPLPIQIPIPFENTILEIKNRISFAYLGILNNRKHFDIQYIVSDNENEKDYMLVYFRVIYSISSPTTEERIIVTETPISINQQTTRGTKSAAKVIKKEN